MDVRFVKPFFYKGELFAWLANTGHWPDVGGMVPGGFSASATEVEQEGLRLPPVKFCKKGEMDQEILSIILCNIRIADQRIGDIKAQAAALTTGEQRLTALIDRYGADVVRAAIAEMRHRAERQMRAKIAGIPDGVYEGTSQVDSDGVVDEPLTIRMKITKKGEDLTFDMTGSSPPCRGPMNSVIATTKSAIYLAIKHIFPDVPINRRHLRAAADRRARGHVPLCQVSAAGVGLRGRGEPAHRRGGVRGAHQGDPRSAVRRARRHVGQSRRRRLRSRAQAQLHHVSLHRRRVRRLPGRRRPEQRLLDHRHLQDAAGRGAGAVLSRCCSRSSRCARARAAPASSAAASASTTRSSCAAARRGCRW